MDKLFKGINGDFVRPYLDDIIVFSKNVEEHKRHLREVLGRIKSAGLVLNKNKCKFFREEILVLGVRVGKGVVKPDLEKIKTIHEFKEPTNIRELRSFLGLANYCRGFIPNLSQIEAPLNALLKGESKKSKRAVVLEDPQKDAFNSIKEALTEETMRTQPDFKKEFILTTDVSDIAIGGILSQLVGEGNERMIYAYSKTLDETQRNYGITDKELLAVIKSVEHFRKYLLGREFVLKTDHKAITHMMETKTPSGRMLRWSLKLQEYQFRIEYIKGEANGADGLSRYCNEVTVIDKKNSREEVLKQYHLASGHGSVGNMKFLLERKYAWPGMTEDIGNYVKSCEVCLRASKELLNTKNKLVKASKFGELWECDLICNLPMANGTYGFIFTVIDHYSKWLEAKLLISKDKHSGMHCIRNLIIKKHGVPNRILPDNGKEFKNDLNKSLAKEFGFEWGFASPYHHKTVGAIERTNQTLWSNMRKLSNFETNNWARYLDKAVHAVNISFNRSIGSSPHILSRAKNPIIVYDIVERAKDVVINMEEVRKNVEEVKSKYDTEIQKGNKVVKYDLQPGEKVLIFKEALGNKLEARWKSGFFVVDKFGTSS